MIWDESKEKNAVYCNLNLRSFCLLQKEITVGTSSSPGFSTLCGRKACPKGVLIVYLAAVS